MAALDCTSLWADLCFAHPAFTQLMLQRSGASPLVIKHRFTGETTGVIDNTVFHALSETKRLRTVDLCFLVSHSRLGAFLTSLSRKAGILENLILSQFSDLGGFALPTDLLKEGAPCLRRIQLIGCYITNWSTFPFGPSLTEFQLVQFHGESDGLTPAVLLHVLKRTPNLRRLEFSGCALKDMDAPLNLDDRRDERAALPALRQLKLGDLVNSEIISFFSLVHIPGAASVELAIADDALESSEVSELFTSLQASWQGVPTRVAELKICKNIGTDGPEFRLSNNAGAQLCVSFAEMVLPLPQLVAIVTKEMALSQSLETLSIFSVHLDKASWIHCFGAMPGLKAISMDLSGVWGLVRAIDPDPSTRFTGEMGESEVPTTLPFPALSRLCLTRVKFQPDDVSNPDNAIFDGLTSAFVKRQKMRPMTSLRIDECSHIFRNDYEKIREALPGLDVEWDGNENSMSWEDLEDLWFSKES